MADTTPTPKRYTDDPSSRRVRSKAHRIHRQSDESIRKKGIPKHIPMRMGAKLANEAIDGADSEMQMSVMESEQDAPFSDVVAFMKAGEKGHKTQLTFDMGRLTLTLSLAPSHGKNPDHVYVKCNRKYKWQDYPSRCLHGS